MITLSHPSRSPVIVNPTDVVSGPDSGACAIHDLIRVCWIDENSSRPGKDQSP